MQFTGANTFTGGLTVSGRHPARAQRQGLSSGPLILSGGTIVASTAVTIANPLLLNGTVDASAAPAPSPSPAPTTLLGNGQVTANDTGGTTLSGNIPRAAAPAP